jgi:3D (Asp-Asp-Asp) domain-containing protein
LRDAHDPLIVGTGGAGTLGALTLSPGAPCGSPYPALHLAPTPRTALLASLVALAAGSATTAVAGASGGADNGGVPIVSGGLVPKPGGPGKIPPPPSRHSRGHWLRGVTVTEYWASPEAWFVGRLVKAPGLGGRHRIDWLYSAGGLSMQGQGIGLDGRMYHIASLGSGGWVTATGRMTSPANGWANGSPFWRSGGYWRNRQHAVTFPLTSGGWSAGRGRRYVSLPGVSFAPGASLPLRPYQSIAVDPTVIPLGSRIYVPAYRHDGHGGWFIAQDTGGAVGGRHIDIYRTPPAGASDPGRFLLSQRIYVIRPRR